MKGQFTTSTLRSPVLLYWFILTWKIPLGVPEKFHKIEKSLILQVKFGDNFRS